MTKYISLAGQSIEIKVLTIKEIKECIKNLEIDISREDEVLQGWFDPTSFIIYINAELSPASFKRTLTHEIIHAIFEITGTNCILTDKLEEAICTAVENIAPLLDQSLFNKENYV